jgi:hypothetical protein
MSRFCPNCGTEVDDTAVFCPTCGQAIDQATESEMPAAPAWPEPSEPSEPAQGPAAAPSEPVERPPAWSDAAPPAWGDEAAPPPVRREDMTRVEGQPAAPVAGPPGAGRSERVRPAINLPLTMPVTLSAWLIGIGALLAAIGIVIGLFDGVISPVELILLLALIAIAAAIFFSASLPSVPNLRLATLVVALIGFGIAIDRLGFGGTNVVAELLLFLGTAMAAIGAIILELGRDQPLGGSR